MDKLLWIGSPFFSGSLAECGWQHVHVHNFEEPRVYCFDDLVRLAGFEPDVLVVADKSRPPFVLGMEKFPCLTVFYSVDSHIHSWQTMYAQGFDACLVSLYGHMQRFTAPFLAQDRVWWSPPFARESDQPVPGVPEIWDCLFVGSQDRKTMPKRFAFMEEMARRVPGFHAVKGDYQRLFPQARVLLNHAERGDLNFRVFEAMGCGGCLVTPRVGHGMNRMFVDGEHLVGYAPEDAGDAAYRIDFLLKHPDVREHIRQAAYEEINARHRARHRAEAFTDHLCDLFMMDAGGLVAARQANADGIRHGCLAVPYLLWANEVPQPELKEAYLAAAKGKFGIHGIEA